MSGEWLATQDPDARIKRKMTQKFEIFAPSVNLARPPVGVHKVVEQDPHMTTLCEWEKTVVLHTLNPELPLDCFLIFEIAC